MNVGLSVVAVIDKGVGDSFIPVDWRLRLSNGIICIHARYE
jgi:hypothetical protein